MLKCYRCFACNREKEAWFWESNEDFVAEEPIPADWVRHQTLAGHKFAPGITGWLKKYSVWIPLCDMHVLQYRPGNSTGRVPSS